MSEIRNPIEVVAEVGSQLWNWLGDVGNLNSQANARPGYIHFRSNTVMSPAAGNNQQQVNGRVNPNWNFYWTHTAVAMDIAVGDEVLNCAQHVFINIVGGGGFPILDLTPSAPNGVPLCMWGMTSMTNGTNDQRAWLPSGFSTIEHRVPYAFAAGEDLNIVFTAEAGFSGTARIIDVCLHGVYVNKALTVKQQRAIVREVMAQQKK